MSPERIKWLMILAMMPDEAFSWVLAGSAHVFPDGIGGFMPASRDSIVLFKDASDELIAIMRSKKA